MLTQCHPHTLVHTHLQHYLCIKWLNPKSLLSPSYSEIMNFFRLVHMTVIIRRHTHTLSQLVWTFCESQSHCKILFGRADPATAAFTASNYVCRWCESLSRTANSLLTLHVTRGFTKPSLEGWSCTHVQDVKILSLRRCLAFSES